jgi:hypothetical protein
VPGRRHVLVGHLNRPQRRLHVLQGALENLRYSDDRKEHGAEVASRDRDERTAVSRQQQRPRRTAPAHGDHVGERARRVGTELRDAQPLQQADTLLPGLDSFGDRPGRAERVAQGVDRLARLGRGVRPDRLIHPLRSELGGVEQADPPLVAQQPARRLEGGRMHGDLQRGLGVRHRAAGRERELHRPGRQRPPHCRRRPRGQ